MWARELAHSGPPHFWRPYSVSHSGRARFLRLCSRGCCGDEGTRLHIRLADSTTLFPFDGEPCPDCTAILRERGKLA